MASAPDHCTLWPDRWAGLDWSHCCLAHDTAYALGMDRTAADAALFECVSAATGTHWLAAIMFAGVSVAGWLFWRRRSA